MFGSLREHEVSIYFCCHLHGMICAIRGMLRDLRKALSNWETMNGTKWKRWVWIPSSSPIRLDRKHPWEEVRKPPYTPTRLSLLRLSDDTAFLRVWSSQAPSTMRWLLSNLTLLSGFCLPGWWTAIVFYPKRSLFLWFGCKSPQQIPKFANKLLPLKSCYFSGGQSERTEIMIEILLKFLRDLAIANAYTWCDF